MIKPQEEINIKKFAIPRVVIGADGTPKIVYVDAQTGQTLNSMEGYNVISATDIPNQDISGNENNQNNEQSVSKDIIDETKTQITERTQGDNPGISSPSKGGDLNLGLADRSVANNYGYIDKPGILGITSMLPGMIGTASKVANLGINTNNTMAANRARESMGMKDMGGLQTIANALGLRDTSTIANVNIGNQPYSVGFEATNKLGQTTLTPDEARKRSLITNQPIEEMTRQQNKQFRKEFKDEFPDAGRSKFGLANIKEAFNNLIDNVFGGGGFAGKDSFPDTPMKNESFGDNEGFSKEQYESNLSGLSDRTRDAVENNKGGLF